MIVNLGAWPDDGDRKHKQFRPELFIKDSSFDQSEAIKRPWRDPIVPARRSPFASKIFSAFLFLQTVLSSDAEHGV